MPSGASTSGFFNVLRLYQKQRLGVVLMGNTTRYDHEAIIAAILENPQLRT